VALGAKAGVGRVLLFHHDPARTDDEIDAICASFGTGTAASVPVVAAAEGDVLDLG